MLGTRPGFDDHGVRGDPTSQRSPPAIQDGFADSLLDALNDLVFTFDECGRFRWWKGCR